jgi:hypothetical protein
MYGLTIFVGGQIQREINWLAANFAVYFFGERAGLKIASFWTVTSSLFPEREAF